MDGDGAAINAPQSVAEVEELVKRLYKPGPARIITQINDQLQQLQNSAEGWQLADQLMGSNDANVRFFAALTFQVKLNNDGPTLDAETAQTVQSRLISWLVRLHLQGEGALVTRKLCSTLTTYFIRSKVLWRRPLAHVACSLRTGDVVSESSVDTNGSFSGIIADLDGSQLIVSLWFAATLADEVSRVDSNTPAHGQIHGLMETIVQDASQIIGTSFNSVDVKVRAEALKGFLTWVNYAQPVWPRNPAPLQHLRNLIRSGAQCLTDTDLQRDALDVFRDILESYTSFFQPQHMHMLGQIVTDHVQPALLQALQDRNPEGLPYGQMVIAYGTANIQEIVEQPVTPDSYNTIVKLHFDILRAPGYPGDEDELSILSIEFWNTYVEHANDTIFSLDADEPSPSWLPSAKLVLSQLVELICAKMWTPPSQIAKDWTEDESDGFREFRLDATDLMLSVYVFLGRDMLQQLATLVLQCLEAKQWRALEAGLFCLNALADNALEDQANEDILGAVFRSSLFREVGDFSKTIPSQVRRTAIDILGSYGQYIERHAEYLPDAIRFLFASLENGLLANTAAKSIASICSACRLSLTGELDGFLQQYQRFLSGPTSDAYTKEKVIGGIAAIIQALKPESAKVQPLLALMENVEKDVQIAKDCSAAGDTELAETMGVTGLNCLASIGKGLQLPEDVPINIYDDDDVASGQSNFWNSAEAQVIQQRIMGCFSVLQVLGNDGEAIDAACQVLRSGFAESEPGPFVLPPSITVSFLQQCSVTTPQLETVLATACILITQHSRATAKRIDDEVRAICEQVTHFIQQIGEPSQDPGIAQGCIDVFCRLVPYYTHLLLEEGSQLSQQLPIILHFTLQAIEAADVFPRRSASEFWAKLIRPPSVAVVPSIEQRISRVVSAYGPQLALMIMRQIGGLGQRSELDYLCEPLKALITNQPSAKSWLEAALFSDAFAQVTDRVGEAEKRRFLQQIVGLRGDSRKTKDVVKEFYAACRGTIVNY